MCIGQYPVGKVNNVVINILKDGNGQFEAKRLQKMEIVKWTLLNTKNVANLLKNKGKKNFWFLVWSEDKRQCNSYA